MFGNPHPAQGMSSASASVMTQLPKPAQAATPQMSMDEAITLVKNRQKEKEINFEDDIQGLEDLPMFAEAEKRAILKPTLALANDFPVDKAGQKVLALGFYNSLMSWLTQAKPGVSKMAMNRLKSKNKFSFKMAAWKLLVFKSHYLARGVSANNKSQDKAKLAQRGELLLDSRFTIEYHETFNARCSTIMEALKVSDIVHLIVFEMTKGLT